MNVRHLVGPAVITWALWPSPALAQGRGGQGHRHGSHSGAARQIGLGAVGGGYGGFGFWYVASIGPNGPFMMIPPLGLMGPLAIPPAVANGPLRGPLAPPPPPGWFEEPAPAKASKPVGRQDPARASQLVVMGDRLFRAGKVKNAEDRYSQAARLDAASAGPRIRLAQVALVREQYAEAAHWYREAETAQPGWIVTAPDVQGIFLEPTDFARYVARLESYLQAHPEDRDAWLVLGAEWYLSGRTARAADVFLRLNDPTRKTDIALAAFLDATNQH